MACGDLENLWAPLCCGAYDVQAATAAAVSLLQRLGNDPGLFDKVPPKTMMSWKDALHWHLTTEDDTMAHNTYQSLLEALKGSPLLRRSY